MLSVRVSHHSSINFIRSKFSPFALLLWLFLLLLLLFFLLICRAFARQLIKIVQIPFCFWNVLSSSKHFFLRLSNFLLIYFFAFLSSFFPCSFILFFSFGSANHLNFILNFFLQLCWQPYDELMLKISLAVMPFYSFFVLYRFVSKLDGNWSTIRESKRIFVFNLKSDKSMHFLLKYVCDKNDATAKKRPANHLQFYLAFSAVFVCMSL